jgi:hypothetical protein
MADTKKRRPVLRSPLQGQVAGVVYGVKLVLRETPENVA